MVFMRRVSLLLIMLLLLQSLVYPIAAQEEAASAAIRSGCSTLDAQVPLMAEQVLDTAASVILYDLGTDTMLHAWNADARIDPSGMNKIMTAMLALEQGKLDAVVTVSRDALKSVGIGSVSAGLKAGEQLTLQDLLYCMMVGSANDASAVIAEYIGGNQAAFVTMMNERAVALGCQDTLFMNPSGLSHESQYTTARDLAKITAAALENTAFTELFGAVSYTVPATDVSEERGIITTNHLMSKETVSNQYDERVTGGKTGALSTTDRSLISTAEKNGTRLLSVVMSAKGSVTANGLSVKRFGNFEETRKLLDHGFDLYSHRQLLDESRVMGQFSVVSGDNDVIGRPASAVVAAMPLDFAAEEVTYTCRLPEGGLQAPISAGQVIGTVEMWFGNVCVGNCDLVAMHAVAKQGTHHVSIAERAEDRSGDAWKTWLLIGGIAILVLAALAGLYILALRIFRRSGLERRYVIRRKHRQRRG